MAEVVTSEYEFPKPGAHLRYTTYPLDTWFDGQTWRLTQGDDFVVKADSMRHLLYRKARARQLKIRVHVESETTLVLRVDRSA